jgi:hypothetical protein
MDTKSYLFSFLLLRQWHCCSFQFCWRMVHFFNSSVQLHRHHIVCSSSSCSWRACRSSLVRVTRYASRGPKAAFGLERALGMEEIFHIVQIQNEHRISADSVPTFLIRIAIFVNVTPPLGHMLLSLNNHGHVTIVKMLLHFVSLQYYLHCHPCYYQW